MSESNPRVTYRRGCIRCGWTVLSSPVPDPICPDCGHHIAAGRLHTPGSAFFEHDSLANEEYPGVFDAVWGFK